MRLGPLLVTTRLGRLAVAAAVGSSIALPVGRASTAAAAPLPAVQLKLFATAPAGATKPDDITKLGRLLYVTYQNNAGKDGSPPGSFSTIVAFDHAGHAVATYTLTGRCDGLTADPTRHRIFASVNEDLNSSLYVITPGDAQPVVHYTYSPSPAQSGSDSPPPNGGTDAIAITPEGRIYVAHSNPDVTLPPPNNTAAVYQLTLDEGIAHLERVFGVNDTAAVINPMPGGPESAKLGLTDPDSNRFLPGPDGGTLIQDAQADSKLVFATDLGSDHPTLRQLLLTNAGGLTGGPTPQLDDIERVAGKGVLYVVDQKGGNIYSLATSKDQAGTLFVSQPAPAAGDQPNTPALAVVDPQTGVVTHVNETLGSPKGLLFVPARHPDDGGDGTGANQ